MNDPMTLYKLMCLYMMRQVNFPLTNNQLTEFFLNHEYTNYFTLQQAISELVESKLISVETIHNTSRYMISREGETTLDFFGKKIPEPITSDIDEFIKSNKFKMRNEISSVADYYKLDSKDYTVHCEVREGKTVLINMDLSVPDEKQAIHMVEKWKDKSTEIYSFAIKSLMSE